MNRRREEIGKVRRWVVVMSRVVKEGRMTIVKVRQVYFDGLSKVKDTCSTSMSILEMARKLSTRRIILEAQKNQPHLHEFSNPDKFPVSPRTTVADLSQI